jgi:hypothetical protein
MGGTKLRTKAALTALLALAAGLLAAPPADAAEIPSAAEATAASTGCAAPVASTTQPGYTVADPRCDVGTSHAFAPLADAAGRPLSRAYAGIEDGAAYRIEVPRRWNGDLVVFAHGYRGTGTTVWVDDPTLRAYYVQRGFAWAASSYQTNGYDVGQGVRDSYGLITRFHKTVRHRPAEVYMTGLSMGGQITAVAIEHHPRTFVAAMPYCGVLGGASLFDYFLDANVTAAAITGTPITFPLRPGADYAATYRSQVLAELPLLGSGLAGGSPPTFTPLGQQWGAAVEQRSGGARPGFAGAFAYWNAAPSGPPLTGMPFLFGLYPGLSGGTAGIANGNVTSNVRTLYQLDNDRRLSPAEQRLNAGVLRVAATAPSTDDLSGIPAVQGRPEIPVLSLHGLGDLFVPFSMEQVYADRVADHHRSGLFVSRAVRSVGHCDFSQAELQRGFSDLVRWVHTGHRPAGDDIRSAAAVADPGFGCRFTEGTHAHFAAAPCPAGTRKEDAPRAATW